MDFESLTQQNNSMQHAEALSEAMDKARKIAAKIAPPGTVDIPDENSPHGNINDPEIVAQIRALADQGVQSMDNCGSNGEDQMYRSQAAIAAAQAASHINAKLGIQSAAGVLTQLNVGGMSNMGSTTENLTVPDRLVGLVIGKGGEQIAHIQAETGVKVQFAPDSNGEPERPCTLTGPSVDAIVQAKKIIANIIAKGQGIVMDMHGQTDQYSVEVMVPGPKCGLIIGKGGETIKQLQEKAGVKMVMIQDSNTPTQAEKALRISGDPNRCQRAKEMVLELLSEKEGYGNEFGNRGSMEIPVPRGLVGVIIGKGGDMIKKIQAESNARVQFKPDGPGEDCTPERMCSVNGTPDTMQVASSMISELIQNALNEGRSGAVRGRGQFNGQRPSAFNNGRTGGYKEETTFCVPSDKCGLVIGKGGDTIRELNRESNARIELSKVPTSNTRERMFRIEGNPQEIHHAIQLICDKAGIPCPDGSYGMHGGDPYMQNGGGTMHPGYGGMQGQQQQQQQQQAGWGQPQQGQNMQQWNQQPTNAQPGDPKAAEHAAAWAAYYNQYYPQQQIQAQPTQQMQPQQQTGQTLPNGQIDFSAAWAEYYRKQGLHAQAQQVLNQAQQNQTTGQGQIASNSGQPQQAGQQAPIQSTEGLQAQSPQ